jgi:crossover junction endodeoxyribonuclease RuvC
LKFVIAFDPSLNGTGYAVLDVSFKKPRLVESGTIQGRNKTWGTEDSHQVRLALITSKVRELVAKYRPAHQKVFLEKGFSNKFVNATQLVFKARGALESELVGFEVEEIAATSVKKILTEHGHAHKSQVAECVADFLNVPLDTFKTEDESDAAAVAVAGWLKFIKEVEPNETKTIVPVKRTRKQPISN